MKFPESIQKLINEFAKLPTVGPKTAERYVFYLLKQGPSELKNFSEAIINLKKDIIICKDCLAVTEKSPCKICVDKKRDHSSICIVANTRDMTSIESTGEYNGTYHVLGGLLDAIHGIKPEQLTIKQLVEKIKKGHTKEIILALNPTIEGETTSLYLTKILKTTNIKVTRLARGLAMGSDLEYADEMTLINALKYRNKI